MKSKRSRKLIHKNNIFSFFEEQWSPSEEIPTKPFYRLESDTWVNIIPLTVTGEVVMVRQFRWGVQKETLEIPGGLVDAEDSDPMMAAHREMIEETGYNTRQPLIELASISPNPALFNNRVATYLARDVMKVSEPDPDPHEALNGVELVPLREIPHRVLSGDVDHALVICAFFLLDAWIKERNGMGV